MKIMKSMLALLMLLTLLLAVGCDADDKSKGADTPAADKPAATDKKDAGAKNGSAKPAEKIGIKVYYQFPETGHFLLNIDLWHSPKGKLEGGKASPFFAPNATVKSGK